MDPIPQTPTASQVSNLIPQNLKILLVVWYIEDVLIWLSGLYIIFIALSGDKIWTLRGIYICISIIILLIAFELLSAIKDTWKGKRKNVRALKVYSVVVGILSIPFGTILGIATFIILGKPKVKEYLKN